MFTKTKHKNIRKGLLFAQIPIKTTRRKLCETFIMVIVDIVIILPFYLKHSELHLVLGLVATAIITVIIPTIKEYSDFYFKIVRNSNILEVNKRINDIGKELKRKPIIAAEIHITEAVSISFSGYAKDKKQKKLEKLVRHW